MLPLLKLPLAPAALVVIAAAFVLPGLGHDPWKTHDAVGIGVIHGMALSGDLLVPRIAGAPWLYDSPLYFWIATAFGKAFGIAFEFHAAARLASAALMLSAFYFAYRAARDWTDDPAMRRTAGSAAMLLVLGSVGLLMHSHEAVPELASLAALCVALATLPYAQRRPLLAGTNFGLALGCAALASTWVAPAALFVAVAAAHFVCPQWRTRARWPFLGLGLFVGVVLAASWPLALYLRAPQLFAEWRVLAFSPEGLPVASLRYYLSTGSWFTWPAWPLALWAAWSLRRRWNDPRLFVPAVASVAMLAGLPLWSPTEDVALIPALAPLALLASHGVFTLRRGAAGALDWFGVLTFAVFAALLWIGYFGALLGVPPAVARNLARIAPGYAAQFSPLAIAFTLALTCAWLYLIFFTPHAPLRSVARWAAGIALLWGTFAMLALPWIDYQRSYRGVAQALRARIPEGAGCISGKALGVSQAAALDYHGDIRTRPFDPLKSDACRLLLIQGGPKEEEFDVPSAGWRKLADVGRPGDRNERYRLYRRGK